jgi:hypothetical protein
VRTLWLIVLIACDAPPLTPGGYHLRVDASSFWPTYDAWYEVAPGGELAGHGWTDAYRCGAQLSADDLATLTDQLDSAHVLDHGDSPPPGCADETSWQIEIDAVEGPAAGRHNTFYYDDCDGEDHVDGDVVTVLDTLARHIGDASAAGLCTDCPTELAPTSCYDATFGVTRFCQGQALQTCDATAAGVTIACDQQPSLQCDPSMGWIPASTWTIAAATVYRWNDGTSTSYWLVLEIDVDVQGPPIEIWRLVDFIAPANANGTSLPFHPGTLSAIDGSDLSGQQRRTFGFQLQSDATTYATIAIRERPWDQSPYGAAVAVSIIDGPPQF